VSDLVAQYVTEVRSELQKPANGGGLTVPELCDRLNGCSDTIVRRALDVLVYLGEVHEGPRHTPGRRGAMPRVYRANPIQ
jgi:hypothetical protein